MKEFFLNILSNLDKLAGLRQIEKIYGQHSDQVEAKKEVNMLLDILVNICLQFPYIPDDDKKKIIQQAVVSDPEFNSLNARIVFKWLAIQKDKYYKEIAHIENQTPENYEIVTGEKKEEYLKLWLASLEPMQQRVNPISKKEIQILGKDRDIPTDYQPMSKYEVEKREQHLAWIRANFDKNGDKLPTFQEESIWLELNNK